MIGYINIILVTSNIFIFYPIYVLCNELSIKNEKYDYEVTKLKKDEDKLRQKILLILLGFTLLFSCLQHLTECNSMKYNLNGLEINIYGIPAINFEIIFLLFDRFFASLICIYCIYDIIKRKFIIYKYPHMVVSIIFSIILITISDHFITNKKLYMIIHTFWHFSIYICFGNYLLLSA